MLNAWSAQWTSEGTRSRVLSRFTAGGFTGEISVFRTKAAIQNNLSRS
jgi:hypothetical protein